MAAKQEAAARVKRIAKEIEVNIQLWSEGLRVDDSALEGVGTEYAEQVSSWLFDMDQKGTPRLIPQTLLFPEGTIVELSENLNSPHVLVKEDGQLLIKEKSGEILMEGISYKPRPKYYRKSTADGTPYQRLLFNYGTSKLFYTYAHYCQYQQRGGTCHFCNMNWSVKEYHEEIVSPQKKLQQIKEPLVEALKEGRFTQFCFSGGMMPEEQELQAILLGMRAIKEVVHLDRLPLVVVHTAPVRRETIETLHKEGVWGVGYNLELGNPDYFKAICPGKAKNQGQAGFEQALLWAVEIFGKGRVKSNFVTGLEPMEFTLEKMEWCASNGIIPMATCMNPGRGSKIEGFRTPTLEWYLTLTEKIIDLWFKYNLVDPYSREPSYCVYCDHQMLAGHASVLHRMLQNDPNWTVPKAPTLNSLMASRA